MLKNKMVSAVFLPSDVHTKAACSEDPLLTEKVRYYREWLANDTVRNRIANSAARIDEYQHLVAMSSTVVNGQDIVTFAPFQQLFYVDSDWSYTPLRVTKL